MSELPDTARIHRLLAAQNPDAAAWALPITFHQVPHARWLAAALAVLRETPSHVDAIGHLLESLDWTPEVRHLVEVELTRGALEGAPRTMLWLLYAHHEDTTPPGPAPPADGLGGWLLEGLSRGYRRWREHLGNAHARHRAEAPRDGELPGLVAEALDLLEGVDLDDDDDDHLLLEALAQVDGLLLWARDGTPDATDATADLDVLGPRAAQVHEALEDDARGARWAWALRAAAQQRRLLQRASLDELLAHSHDHRATWTWQELLPNALRGAPDLAAVLAGPGRDLPQGRLVGWVGASHPVVVADWLLARRSDPEASQVVWYGPLDEAPEVVRALLPHLADDALSRAVIEAMGAIRETWCADAVVAHLLDWTRAYEDDDPIWRAAARLADRRLAAPLAHPGLQHSPGAAWVTRVLSDVWGLPIDRGQRDFADDYQRAVPEFPALRIRCDDCGAWGDVPLQSGTYAADDADVVDGWDGFTPEEPVTCPWCGSVDRYQASRPSVRALARNADELPVRLRAGVVARLPDGSVAARVSTLFEGLRTHAERVDSAPAWLALADAQALHGLPSDDAVQRAIALDPWSADVHQRRITALGPDDPDALGSAAIVIAAGAGVPFRFWQGLLCAECARLGVQLRWRHGERVLTGVANLPEVRAIDVLEFVGEVDLVAAELLEGHGDAGWFERWQRGERPPPVDAKKKLRDKRKAERQGRKRSRKR